MRYTRKPTTWMAIVLSALLLMVAQPASAAIFRYDGPYEGKVVDADSGDPIQGAVVLGVWYRIHPNVAGWNSEFYDAVETLTDKNGEFHIKGLGPLFMSNIDEMMIVIFKVRYEHLGHSLWKSLKVDYILKQKIKWDRNKAIIPLKKLTLEQRRNRFGDYMVTIPDEKQTLLLDEIEKEDKDIER
jgi:hypothetical protein